MILAVSEAKFIEAKFIVEANIDARSNYFATSTC
jgi:hypothetical protein